MKRYNPVVLIIRDGWGSNHNPMHDTFNAIKLAHTPCSDMLSRSWPHTEIMACGLDVGLPEGVMGNSEVGHQNIGAGRIVDQEIVRINKAFKTGALKTNKDALATLDYIRKHKGKLHLMGLVSDAGVHSMLDHLYGLLQWAQDAGLKEAYIHAITDGRDTPPMSGLGFIEAIETRCKFLGIGTVATVCGRFWAMDRDKRWDRIEKAYSCFTGKHPQATATSAQEAVKAYYNKAISPTQAGDEFVLPTQILGQDGTPIATITDGDSLIFFNFRGDRPREITAAFIQKDFDGFDRGKLLNIHYTCMTEYQKGLCSNILFRKPPKMDAILGAYISQQGIPQFRCAETEKYPHVTFFFNDYREEPFPLEDHMLIPSPKDVVTYDQKPEMSAPAVTQATQEAILSRKYGLIVVNFANADMVGHTGSLDAAIKAAEAVDQGISILLKALDEVEGKAIITADHGNADQMWEPELKTPHTRHTLNPVEVVLYGKGCKDLKLKSTGRLADLAPTLLELMGLAKPKAMTGESLII